MKTIHLLQINLHISPEISLKFSIVILGESEEFYVLLGGRGRRYHLSLLKSQVITGWVLRNSSFASSPHFLSCGEGLLAVHWNVSDGQWAILPWTQARLGLSFTSSKNIPWQGYVHSVNAQLMQVFILNHNHIKWFLICPETS